MKHLYFIGPVGSDPQFNAKKLIIEEAAGHYGFGVHFPFSAGVPQDMQQIMSEIRSSYFVLADLSRERPSCYFELGVAEAVGAEVLLIAEAGTPIHQTRNRNVGFYSNIDDYRNLVMATIARNAEP